MHTNNKKIAGLNFREKKARHTCITKRLTTAGSILCPIPPLSPPLVTYLSSIKWFQPEVVIGMKSHRHDCPPLWLVLWHKQFCCCVCLLTLFLFCVFLFLRKKDSLRKKRTYVSSVLKSTRWPLRSPW